jgi:hypothetical protein
MADLIDRDLTIHELEAFRESCIANLLRMSFDDITDVVKDIPAVNRWIPCSERLPEDNAEVLVSFCRRYVKIGYIEPGDGLRYWVIPGHSVAPLNYIEAWMPMPDAYEPQKGEQK